MNYQNKTPSNQGNPLNQPNNAGGNKKNANPNQDPNCPTKRVKNYQLCTIYYCTICSVYEHETHEFPSS